MAADSASLASGRAKRATAGAKMAKLLDNEEEDEFYKSTYGGFNEEEDDRDYQSEASDVDHVDSDFDIDENDELKSDHEDDGDNKRKKRAVNTKAYKEPVKKKAKTEKSPTAEKKKKKKPERSTAQIYHSEKKSVRKTTAERTKEAEVKRKELEAKKLMLKEIARKKNVAEVRRLTQEELLEEAKITEEINLRSLETYHRLELERRKTRVVKQAYRGPMIRYHSMTMPLIEELPDAEINVDGENENGDGKKTLKPSERIARTFITFTDETTADEIFPRRRLKVPVKQFCPVTRLPAKYYDPITKTPYANCQAFRIIREAYAKQTETTSGGAAVDKKRKHSQVQQVQQMDT